jgi:hypothetical protein
MATAKRPVSDVIVEGSTEARTPAVSPLASAATAASDVGRSVDTDWRPVPPLTPRPAASGSGRQWPHAAKYQAEAAERIALCGIAAPGAPGWLGRQPYHGDRGRMLAHVAADGQLHALLTRFVRRCLGRKAG